MKPLNVGLMVPINNTTMERELLAWLPAHSMCHTVKIPRGKGLLTPETVPAYKEAALELAKKFADMPLDAVVYGCTAAGFIMGPAADTALAGELARVTGKPVITTARSMIQALGDSKAREIALVTPYSDAINRQLKAFLETSGISVRRFNTFGAESTDELGRIQAPEVAEMARKTMADDCDALFIACSQLPTHEILDDLQREFPRPVWSSIFATAWQTKRAVA